MSDGMDRIVDMVFAPTEEMREWKWSFWAKAAENIQIDADNLTLASIQGVVGSSPINKWWHVDGFREWFSNKDEWRQKVEYAINVGVDSMLDILRDPKANAGARVRAFEVLARLANREPAKTKEIKLLDSDIQNMDQRQLEAFLEKNGVRLLKKG